MTQNQLNFLYKGLGQDDEELDKHLPEDAQSIVLDYREFSSDAAHEFKTALAKFGITMLDDPRLEGSDQYGFLLFKK